MLVEIKNTRMEKMEKTAAQSVESLEVKKAVHITRKNNIERILQERKEGKAESAAGKEEAPHIPSEENAEAQTEARDGNTQDRNEVPEVAPPEEFIIATNKNKDWVYSRGPGEDFKIVDGKSSSQNSDQAREGETETVETPKPGGERPKDNSNPGIENAAKNNGNEAEKAAEPDQETTDEETEIRRQLDENESRTKELQKRLNEIKEKKAQGDRSRAETQVPKTGEADTSFQEWVEQNTGMDESFRQRNYAEEELINKEKMEKRRKRLDFGRRKFEEIITGEGVIKDLGIMIRPEWEKIEQAAEHLERRSEGTQDNLTKEQVRDMEMAIINLRDRLQAEMSSEKLKKYESSGKKPLDRNKADKLLKALNGLIHYKE